MENNNILKNMYKMLPMELRRQKHDLVFYLSNDVYQKIKHQLHNGRFLGIKIDRIFNN